MCVIFHFTPGATFNRDQFFNAVHNNWHGFGLVLKDENNHLQVIKKFSETAIDPEEVFKLIEDNKDITRYLHLRHSTRGAADESNVHPFCVYHSNSEEIHFMHNGTLTGFGDYQGKGASDTKEFCEKILEPSLLCWNGPRGKADYTDPNYIKLVVDKQWSYVSTGLFVSKTMPALRIGTGWSQYKHPDGTSEGEVWVSNTSYFEKVSRGPYFLRLEAIKKAEEEAKKASEVKNNTAPFHGTNSGTTTHTARAHGIKQWDESGISKDPAVVKALNDIISRWDFESPSDLAKLHSVAYDEWLDFIDDDKECGGFTTAAFIEHLIDCIVKLSIKNATLTRKQAGAQKKLQEYSIKYGKEEDRAVATAA